MVIYIDPKLSPAYTQRLGGKQKKLLLAVSLQQKCACGTPGFCGTQYRRIHTQHAVPMPRPCCSHAVSLPCRALIHTCHAVSLPCSDSAVCFVKVRMVAGNIRTASQTV
jgi:hypothetical protein